MSTTPCAHHEHDAMRTRLYSCRCTHAHKCAHGSAYHIWQVAYQLKDGPTVLTHGILFSKLESKCFPSTDRVMRRLNDAVRQDPAPDPVRDPSRGIP